MKGRRKKGLSKPGGWGDSTAIPGKECRSPRFQQLLDGVWGWSRRFLRGTSGAVRLALRGAVGAAGRMRPPPRRRNQQQS